MKKHTLVILAAALTLLLTCCAAYDPVKRIGESRYKSIVVIGVDGGGAFFNEGDALTDDFKAFFSTADSHLGVTDCLCETPSISAQNWGAYLHGTRPEKIEVNNFRVGTVRFTDRRYPSVFQVIHDVDPSCTLASICHWSPINYGLIETSAGVYKDSDIRFSSGLYSDGEVVTRVKAYAKDNSPDLLFVHLDDCDAAGHSHGYGSPEHIEALHTTQGRCLDIFSAFDPETTLFIVISDHGGTPEGTHGGDTPAEMHITFAIRGKGLDPAALDNFTFRPRDLSPIILTAMGIEVPSCMEGVCPTGLFKD